MYFKMFRIGNLNSNSSAHLLYLHIEKHDILDLYQL